MTTPAAIYINPDHDALTEAGQMRICLETADRLGLDLRYWARSPLDAPPLVADGRSAGLVVAAPDVISPTLMLDAVTAQIELAGGRLYVPTSRHHVYTPDVGVQMAARLRRRGWSEDQVADVLEIDTEGVRALLQQAARRGLLGAIPLVSAWLHDRAGRAALIAVTAAGVVTGVEWVETPRTTALPSVAQSPAAARATPRIALPAPPSPSASLTRPAPSRSAPPASPSPSMSPTPSPSRSRLAPRLPRSSVPACLRSLPAHADLPHCDLLPT